MEPSLRLRWRVLKLKPTQLHTSFSESSGSSAKWGGSCRLRMRNRRTCEGTTATNFSLVRKRDVTLYRHSAAKAHRGKRLREAKRDVTLYRKAFTNVFYDLGLSRMAEACRGATLRQLAWVHTFARRPMPNVLHRRAQTVGSQSLEGGDGNASLSICVNAELANES